MSLQYFTQKIHLSDAWPTSKFVILPKCFVLKLDKLTINYITELLFENSDIIACSL